MIEIRLATEADAKQIAEVHVAAWRTTYQGIIDAEYLNELSVVEREQNWRYYFSQEGIQVVVAVTEEQRIIGFGATVLRQHQSNTVSYIDSLYVLKKYQQQGGGEKLLEWCLS